MASNKDSKTSKTAHVMNLLSKNRNAPPAEPISESAPASPDPAAAAPAAAGPAVPALSCHGGHLHSLLRSRNGAPPAGAAFCLFRK